MLAAKPEDLSSTPGTSVEEEETDSQKLSSDDLPVHATPAYTRTHRPTPTPKQSHLLTQNK